MPFYAAIILPPSTQMTRPAASAATRALRDSGSETSCTTSSAVELALMRSSMDGVAFATVFGAERCGGATLHDEHTILRWPFGAQGPHAAPVLITASHTEHLIINEQSEFWQTAVYATDGRIVCRDSVC